MDDLISRQKTIYAVESLREDYISKIKMLMLINQMPSTEQERKAKVKELERRSETSIGWEGICTNCGAYTIREMDFCFQCGAKLEWE